MSGERTTHVDVIIPTRNRFDLTSEAIESVRGQTHREWRLWVVDDASDDQSGTRLAERFADDPRVHIVTAPTHGGQQRARQIGFEQGDAPLVAFLDSDDLWLPEKLTMQIDALAERADDHVGVVLCSYTWCGNGKSRRRTPRTEPGRLYHTSNMSIPLVRREVLDTVGGVLRPGGGELTNAWHVEFYLRLGSLTPFDVVDEPLVVCRNHRGARASDSVGRTMAAAALARTIELHESTLRSHPRDRAQLEAAAGARFLRVDDPIGFRYLGRSLRGVDLRYRAGLLWSYGPYTARAAARLAWQRLISRDTSPR